MATYGLIVDSLYPFAGVRYRTWFFAHFQACTRTDGSVSVLSESVPATAKLNLRIAVDHDTVTALTIGLMRVLVRSRPDAELAEYETTGNTSKSAVMRLVHECLGALTKSRVLERCLHRQRAQVCWTHMWRSVLLHGRAMAHAIN